MTLPPPQPLDAYPCSPDSSPSHFAVRQYTPTAITAAYPVVVTIPAHGFQNGQAIRATRFIVYPTLYATGMEQLNNRLFYVQQATTDTFHLSYVDTLPVDGRAFTPFVNNGVAEFTLTGPTLPIVNPSYPPPPGVPDPFG